jgi:UDP-glucuronate 4-epimerase
VDDAAHSVSSSLRLSVSHDSHAFFRIWNLGGSHPITLAEMIDTIARTVGRPAKIKRLPMQPGDVERTWADLTRSNAELGFAPRTSFEEGVRRQWAWLLADDSAQSTAARESVSSHSR